MKRASAPAIGIDFGTTNSVVALAHADGRVEAVSWPSGDGVTDVFRTALMFWREGRTRVGHVAGPQALQRALAAEGEQRFIQSIKSHLASPLFTETRLYGVRFTIEDLVQIFLTHLLENRSPADLAKAAVAAGRPVVFAGEKPDDNLGVTRLRAAFAAAGLSKVEFAYEPLGAAYWYARDLKRDETVLVADFGGGTSDFSILRFAHKPKKGVRATPLAHSGVGVAGDTFDYRIIDHLVAPRLGKHARFRSFDKLLPMPAYFYAAFAQWHQLSWLKSTQTLSELKRLAAASEDKEAIEALVVMIEMDLGFELYRAVSALKAELSQRDAADFVFEKQGISIAAEIKRGDFENWIAADLAKIAHALDSALAAAKLSERDIDAVFMTGGTSFVPAVRRLFLDRFPPERLHLGDAFQSVASGLALLAADRSRHAT